MKKKLGNNTARNRAQALNTLVDFLAVQDINELDTESLKAKYGMEKADVLVLFGGSILTGADLMAEAMDRSFANCYAIVGGFGHTTPAFQENLLKLYPDLQVKGNSEAELFDSYLGKKYNKHADVLEIESTNCGNNITYLLNILEEKNISHKNMVLIHDASMEKRIGATLKKQAPEMQAIHYAAYRVELTEDKGELVYVNPTDDMYDIEHFISLLLSEIPRLKDDEKGYGPNGAGFIAHVDIPDYVMQAYQFLKEEYVGFVR